MRRYAVAILAVVSALFAVTVQAQTGIGGDEVWLTGDFQATVFCYFEEGTSRTEYSLTTDAGKRYILHFYDDSEAPEPGSRATVIGMLSGGHLFVDAVLYSMNMDGGNPTTGEQRAVVLLINFQNDRTENTTTGQVAEMFFGSEYSTDQYWQEGSYEKTWLTGDVFGWYTLPIDRQCNPGLWRTLAIEAADPDVYFPQYNRLYILVPRGGGCGWGGLGTLGMSTFNTQDGPFRASTSWIRSEYYNTPRLAVAVTAHEGGHNFGQHHASSLRFTGQALGGFDCNACGGAAGEYGDRFDALGLWDTGHYNAKHKMNLNWFDDEQVLNVTESGIYTLSPMSVVSNETKAIKILRGHGQNTGNDEWLYFEWRQPIGYDTDLDYFNGFNYMGLLSHFHWNDRTSKTYLLDMTPGDDEFENAALRVGETWTDNYTDLSVRPFLIDGGTIYVEVLIGLPVSPNAFDIIYGSLESGGLSDLFESDDSHLVIVERPAVSVLSPNISVEVRGTYTGGSASQLTFKLETSSTAAPPIVEQRLELFNYSASRWDIVFTGTATPEDNVITYTTYAPDGYIQAGTGEIKARISLHDPGLPGGGWKLKIDQALWTIKQ